MPARTAFVPLLAAALAAGCSSTPPLPSKPAGPAVLEVRGDVEGGPRTLGAADLAGLPQRTVRGTDPSTGRAAAWSGPDLQALVERTRRKPGVDTLVVRTADGGAVVIPLGVLRQLRPVIADRADGAALASPIVAWPTVEQPGLERDPRLAGWWATKPVALELVRWPRLFGRRLAAPQGAPEGARPGAGLFLQRCVVCHAVRGVGGTRGPDLTSWAASHDQAALQARLERHPGRTSDDLEQDFVAPLHSYLTSISRAPPISEETPAESREEREDREKAEKGGKGEGGRPPKPDGG